MTRLNERRDSIVNAGTLVLVVLDNDQVSEFQRFAPDTFSALAFSRDVPFEQDPLGPSLSDARIALGDHLRDQFGHLDLRGFLRGEADDVAWPIEAIYQELRGSRLDSAERLRSEAIEQPVELTALISSALGSVESPQIPVVLLGHPGAGKTLFLRWCAVRGGQGCRVFGRDDTFPVLIPLASFAAAPGRRSLIEYARDQLLAVPGRPGLVLDAAIASRRAVFLLDGLDEVGTGRGRQRCRTEIELLSRDAPGCPTLVTCRVAGWPGVAFPATLFRLEPFDGDQIRRFLVAWCGRYPRDREGPGTEGRGAAEGAVLADQVLTSPSLCDLARTPLLLMILAIVARAHLELPRQRVELYDVALTVLVERWDQLRSLSTATRRTPLRVSDAQRLLGPIAVQLLESGRAGAISERRLLGLFERAFASGHASPADTAQGTVALFRDSIGFLVELRPGWFSFLHRSFLEALAARELVRTGGLEKLVEDPELVFGGGRWMEVLLLSAGELGLIRADDARLDAFVDRIVVAAGRFHSHLRMGPPLLLSGLLADDPALSERARDALVSALIPDFWFDDSAARGTPELPMEEALRLWNERLSHGRHADAIRKAFRNRRVFEELVEQFVGFDSRFVRDRVLPLADVVLGGHHGILTRVRPLTTGADWTDVDEFFERDLRSGCVRVRRDVLAWIRRSGISGVRDGSGRVVWLPKIPDCEDAKSMELPEEWSRLEATSQFIRLSSEGNATPASPTS
ncbi:MAG: NACHT domain-containing protein [Deltaproteobacteria bacterium]|nr:NACHT domain-containing protein [Deltaproteobacteria bacterium]